MTTNFNIQRSQLESEKKRLIQELEDLKASSTPMPGLLSAITRNCLTSSPPRSRKPSTVRSVSRKLWLLPRRTSMLSSASSQYLRLRS